jgi:uncharacterized protein (TIGR04562 family)
MIEKLDFHWNALRGALEGVSALDFRNLGIRTKAQAKNFLLSYGYGDDPQMKEEMWRIYFEALSYIRTELLDEGEKVPEQFFIRGAINEIQKLLMDTSNDDERGKWACALLRVMHIISHVDNDIRVGQFSAARDQIFSRIDQFVKRIPGRKFLFSNGEKSVPLLRYYKKSRKERASLLTKMLAKTTATPERIYDNVGFRFVTETRFDCYRLLNMMLESGAISAPNILPLRSINTLIPYDVLHREIESLRTKLLAGEISLQDVNHRIRQIEDESLVPRAQHRNPFSSPWYRSIQFTSRQLIHAPNAAYATIEEIRRRLKDFPQVEHIVREVPVMVQEKISFFYPFEVQIIDKQSYIETLVGRSRHREYKTKQRLIARNRVLRDLV